MISTSYNGRERNMAVMGALENMKQKGIHFFFFFIINVSTIYTKTIKVGRQVENFGDGNREKAIFHLDKRSQDELDHPLSGVIHRFRRYLKESSTYSEPKNTTVSGILTFHSCFLHEVS